MKSLSSVAKNHNVIDYAKFQSAGYMGMYNMRMNKLREVKEISLKDTLFDYMGKRELAGESF